ncbi:uncharacterized protein LOC130780451 [Actinidia eriantha]|uniref:uncharacterized protein LOC130780451 n=1 Tax=Actinidia eriantha TaxID=165200 RepID=UPI0025895CE7|nr:uncharacterized protein LOC130780451 [Actinidia eriantha]
MRDCEVPLSYGVGFSDGGSLGFLDLFMKENCYFSCLSVSDRRKDVNWREFAPVIEDYNNFLAKAIAGGTGQIVKGIFKCSNAYTNQIKFWMQLMRLKNKPSLSPLLLLPEWFLKVALLSNKFGESAGEATEDAFAMAGHCASTTWNVFKIRKAINPASSVSSGVLKSARKNKKS